LVIPTVVLLSLSTYFGTRIGLLTSYDSLQKQTENNAINAIHLVDNGYAMLEKSIEHQLENAFIPFMQAYEDANRDPAKIDLHVLQKQFSKDLGAEVDLYIISSEWIIEYTTFDLDLGLDFKPIVPERFIKRLENMLASSGFYPEEMGLETQTSRIRKYSYMSTPDHAYLFELGVVFDQFNQFVGRLNLIQIMDDLKALNPSLDNVRIFEGFQGRVYGGSEEEISESLQAFIKDVIDNRTEVHDIYQDDKLIRYMYIDRGYEKTDPNAVISEPRVLELTYNTDSIDTALTRLLITSVAISIVAIILTVIVTYVISDRIAMPILKIIDGVKQIEDGNLDYRLAVQSENELKFLEVGINDMAGQIEERNRQLEELVDTLEMRVAYRTEELSNANEEISVLNERLQEENIRLEAEVDVARKLQVMLLPTEDELKQIQGLDIAGFMEPADEVGGDYYDVLQHNRHVKIGIGDVTGHGLDSGVISMMTQMGVRTLFNQGESDPKRFLSVLNQTIYDNIQRIKSDKNLTLMLMDYTSQGDIRLSGQHEDVIVVRRDGTIKLIDTFDLGMPIGLDEKSAKYFKATSLKLEAGDGIVLYTDGITEAHNMDKELYGLERLCDVIGQNWSQSAEGVKDTVIADVRAWLGKQKPLDDITLLVLKQKTTTHQA